MADRAKQPSEGFSANDIRPADLMAGQRAAMHRDIEMMLAWRDEFVHVSCPACAADRPQPLYEKYGLSHVRCRECDTQYVNPRPGPDRLAQFYQASENYKYWATHVFPASKDVRREKIFVPRADIAVDLAVEQGFQNAALLEVGAGYGLFCDAIRERGVFSRIIAIEPTPDLAEICRGMGLEVIESPYEDVEIDTPVDMIANFEVIEHLFAPDKFLAWLYATLRPGGWLLLTCPNVAGFETRVLGCDSDTVDHQHLNLFTPESLAMLARRVGFDSVKLCTPGRLDVDIVRTARRKGNVPAAALGPYLTDLMDSDDEEGGNRFQDFLAEAGLSSNMRMTARRPD